MNEPPAPSASADPRASRLPPSPLAVASFTCSALGFFCLWGIGGLLGVGLGVLARDDIARSHGQRGGSRLALAGIALGGLNLAACVLAMAVGITFLARPSATFASRPTSSPLAPPSAPPMTPKAAASSKAAAGDTGNASREGGVVVTRVGKLELVDIGPDVHSLGDELDKQRELADRAGQKLIVWIVQNDCQPCDGVAAALPEPSMQTALENVRLVRVSPQEFNVELEQFNIPTDKVPGFVRLGADNHPLDYVNGGEWDADIAANIAPVLGKFVRGSYKQRRDPWRGGARDDETPL